MKFKKALVLAAAMLLTACGSKGGNSDSTSGTDLSGKYNLTVWVGESIVDLTKTQIADFVKENEGIEIEANVVGVSEADSATQVLTDIDAAADLYCFAQDQFARLVQGGALAELGRAATTTVKAENDAGSVGAATSGDKLYAYPLTSDNGYFMYYDKSVITDPTHLTDLDLLVQDCVAAGKNFSFEVETSGWYLASWFFGAGCTSEWRTNDAGKFVGVTDDFNSDKGLKAAKAIQKLTGSGKHVSSSNIADFDAATPSAIVVSGTWAYSDAVKILGENLGAAELPNVTVDGTTFHLGSYSGNKLLGVKPSTDTKKLAVSHRLAQYLTGEKGQTERFNEVAWGPSNLKAQQLDAVKANPALAALLAQGNYARPQGQIHGSWWDISKALGAGIKAATSDAELRAALSSYAEAVADCVTEKEPEWGVVGSMADSAWSTNIPLAKQDDGTYTLDLAMDADVEFKVRDGSNWDSFNTLTLTLPAEITQMDGGNLKVGTAGTYHFVLDDAASTLVITKIA